MAGSCSASVFSVTCEKCNHILEKLSVLTTLDSCLESVKNIHSSNIMLTKMRDIGVPGQLEHSVSNITLQYL